MFPRNVPENHVTLTITVGLKATLLSTACSKNNPGPASAFRSCGCSAHPTEREQRRVMSSDKDTVQSDCVCFVVHTSQALKSCGKAPPLTDIDKFQEAVFSGFA